MPFSSSLRFVWRSLRRSPAFTAAAVISIALGIGANTAIFTLADQAMLRGLPVKDPSRLVMLKWRGQFIGGRSRGLNDTLAYPMYAELRDGNPGVFTGIAARYQDSADVAYKGPAQRATAELVSGNYFGVLEVTAALGRTLTPQDDQVKDGDPYVVLSYDFWRRRFGADPSVLNRVIDINGWPMTVVGVAQRGFEGFEALSPADVFVPMAMKRAITPTWDDMSRRNSIWLKVFARLAPGVTAARAQVAMQTTYHNSLESDLRSVRRNDRFSDTYRKNSLALDDASKGLQQMREFFKPLQVLLAMVGALLLIACVNVANLLITRSAARKREIAIRLSLGATRASLTTLMMMESGMIALAGGLLGLLLSTWVASFLVRMLPFNHVDVAIRATPDGRILAFTAGLSLLTAVLFGLVPALQASRADVAATLKNETGTVTLGSSQARIRKILIGAQVALSLLLLVGAGLFARSLYGLLRVNTGIGTDALLAFSIDPSLHKYPPERSRQFFAALQRDLERIPGAVSVTAAAYPVLADNDWQNTLNVEGYQPGEHEDMQGSWNHVLPGFFSTLGIPLISGREFTERDAAGAAQVIIVNETFVKRFYPHENPLGRHVWPKSPMQAEIVGIVKDFKSLDLREKIKPMTYAPALQDSHIGALTFYIRAAGDPLSLARAARQTVNQADPALPLYDLKTVASQIDETHFIDRLFALLSAAFGVLATVLASVGLYGVTAYAVTRRTREIGVRVALGAGRGNILRLVMREVLVLTAAGLVVGIPAALALGRMVESHLFGIKGSDPQVMAIAVALIIAVSSLAGYIPARRATRIDPMRALRYE